MYCKRVAPGEFPEDWVCSLPGNEGKPCEHVHREHCNVWLGSIVGLCVSCRHYVKVNNLDFTDLHVMCGWYGTEFDFDDMPDECELYEEES